FQQTIFKGCFWLQANPLSADFIFETFLGLQFRRRCARTSSDRFFLAASHYGGSWSSSLVDLNNAICCLLSISDPRACARQGRCPMCLRTYSTGRVGRPAEELSASSTFCK
ncbi:hypothetical protein GBAR_LOCUS18725, partial [Geodia barretti]